MRRPSFAFPNRARTRFRSCPPRFERLEERALLSAVSWTGNAGDNNWDTPGNWSSSPDLPGAADDVTIDVNADVVHSSNVTDSIHSLTSTQPLTITGGTLSIATASTISSTLTLTNPAFGFNVGTLSGGGDITVGGLLSLNLGTLGGTGTVTANGGIAIHSSSQSGLVLDGKTLVNPAGQTATWTGTGALIERNGANIVNNGTFLEQATFGDLTDQGNSGAAVAFTNNGSFIQSNNNGAFTVSGVAFNVNSPGTVDVMSGELDLLGGGASTGGSYTAEAGDPLSFGAIFTGAALGFGGTYTLDVNSSIGGTGTVGFGISSGFATMFPLDANVTIAGSYNVTGTTVLGSATVNFNGPVTSVGSTLMSAPNMNAIASANFNTTFQGSAGVIPTIVIHGGTVNFGTNPITATTLTFTIGGGTSGKVTGTADITVSGLTTLNDGQLTGTGTVTANGGIAGDDSVFVIDGKTLVNPVGQTATFTGFGVEIDLENGASFINNGTFLAQCAGGFGQSNSGAATSFINNGSFIKSNPVNTFSFDGVAFNTTAPGTVDVQGGPLALAGGGTETGASFMLESGASLNFQGDTAFNLDANTSFSGAGTLSFLLQGQTAAPPFVIPGNSPALTGPTQLNGGILVVNGSMPGSAVSVASGGILRGTGMVGAITSVGKINPGTATATGILSANGDVRLANAQLTSMSFFQVALAGADPGTGFDQLAVAGTADITDTTLNASLVSFTPGPGQKFPIITSTAPIVGTFVDLPEGAALTISGVPFTISYVGGINHNDIVLTQASTQTATTTTLSSSANPSTPGQAVTFTAIVAPTTGTGMPTGMVTFTIDTVAQQPVALQDVGGVAEASLPPITNLTAGPHTIAATYNGDTTFATSIATPLTQTVARIDTVTELASSLNPSSAGQAVTFTATVFADSGDGTPSGTVTFFIDSQAQTPVPLRVVGGMDEASTPPITNLTEGDHTIAATYNGDTTFSSSVAFPLTQTVGGAVATTTTALTSSANPSTFGETVTFTASVSPQDPPTGTVTFTIDGTPRSTVPLVDNAGSSPTATFPVSSLAGGNHVIIATYNGDSGFAPSTSDPLNQVVNTQGTTTTLGSSANPSSVGRMVTFTATVSPATSGTPTGNVIFTIDGTPQSPVPLSVVGGNEVATFPDTTLAVGSHTITATYNGDGSFATSTAAPLTQSVLPLVSTTTALTSSINPSIVNAPVTFTAIVQPTSGTAAPGGTVNFLDGTTPIGTGTLGNDHHATFTISTLAAGAHMITAVYAGDADLAGSGSSILLQTVNPAVSATSFVATPNPATAGQPVTLTATVTGSLPPTGSVTFKEGTTVLGTVALNGSGVGSLVLSTLSAGTHVLTAVYSGSSNLTSSTSNTVSLVVNPVAPTDTTPPTVDMMQRFGFHAQPTVLVLTFSRPLAAAQAQNVNNYQIVLKSGHAPTAAVATGSVRVTRAVYDPSTLKLMLFTSSRLNVHNTYQLTVNGTAPGGLTGVTGVPLAGAGNVAGTNYVAAIRFSTVAGPFTQALQPALRQLKHPAKVLAKIPVAELDALASSGELSVQSILAARQHARKTVHHGS